MKKIVLAAVLVAATAGFAAADSDIGCGLGTQLWEGEKGLVPKVLGATTNGTFGNQTFGITTGTLGCSSEGVITADARLRMFAGANLDNLARDMAQARVTGLAFADRLKAHFPPPQRAICSAAALAALRMLT